MRPSAQRDDVGVRQLDRHAAPAAPGRDPYEDHHPAVRLHEPLGLEAPNEEPATSGGCSG
jgi:hypothetical protein